MRMYVRIEELLADHQMTAYALAKRAQALGVSEQAIYRLVRARGQLKLFDTRLLAVLCEVFDLDVGDLLKRGEPPPRKAAKKRL